MEIIFYDHLQMNRQNGIFISSMCENKISYKKKHKTKNKFVKNYKIKSPSIKLCGMSSTKNGVTKWNKYTLIFTCPIY